MTIDRVALYDTVSVWMKDRKLNALAMRNREYEAALYPPNSNSWLLRKATQDTCAPRLSPTLSAVKLPL